jgi:kinesin family protein C2/C3
MENVSLKLKVQSLKDKLAHPAKSEETMRFVKHLHAKVKACQTEKNLAVAELNKDIDALTVFFKQAIALSKKMNENVTSRLDDITKKYRAEQIQRKLLYNKVQELRGNIRVFARVRKDVRGECVMKFPTDTEVMFESLTGAQEIIEFDKAFGPNSKQDEVFEDTKALILSCIDGYNVCIVAYGQTGSGKTFTMMGPPDLPGVNRRAIKELLDLCNSKTEIEYSIRVSLLEVYNEKLFDLLTADRSNTLDIHSGPQGTYVGGLIERVVRTPQDVEDVIEMGNKNRTVASTMMNTDSSRSHLLLQLTVSGVNKISKVTSFGKLTLVDLAGSERVSKTDASGERLVEAAAINKSLTALGQVFKALATGAPHVPYRNSKLTHVLQDSLGGDSKTCVFVNVSPLASNLAESICTLRFGQNIRKIELGPASKNKAPAGPPGKPAPAAPAAPSKK